MVIDSVKKPEEHVNRRQQRPKQRKRRKRQTRFVHYQEENFGRGSAYFARFESGHTRGFFFLNFVFFFLSYDTVSNIEFSDFTFCTPI